MKPFKFFIGYTDNFDHLRMPEVLRYFAPNLIADDLVPVQPLSTSRGRIFYMDFNYDTQ